mmetsp:Transcript_86795/g.260668  ORF Transcript_86795/g.260668 Transcript_86795/m.260668 type:complete len:272 (-) Transcript_86795:2785-3600(-)
MAVTTAIAAAIAAAVAARLAAAAVAAVAAAAAILLVGGLAAAFALHRHRRLARTAARRRARQHLFDVGHAVGGRARRRTQHVLQRLLLVAVVLPAHDRAEPLRVLDAWHRVVDLLARRGDRDDLLDRGLEPRAVVAPVDDRADVRSLVSAHRAILEPPPHKVHLDRLLRVKDGYRDRALRHRRVGGLARDDVLAREAGVLDHLIAKKLGEAARDGDGRRLLGAIVLQRSRHRLLLRDELEQVVVLERLAARVQHVEPIVGDRADRGVALLQ